MISAWPVMEPTALDTMFGSEMAALAKQGQSEFFPRLEIQFKSEAFFSIWVAELEECQFEVDGSSYHH